MDLRVIICLFMILALTFSARLSPTSPCPRIFQYEMIDIPKEEILFPGLDNPLWRGVVTIPGQLHRAGESAMLKVIFTISNVLRSKYVGKIEVRGGKSKFLQNGSTTLQYDVSFPRGIAVPNLNRVIFNGRVICSGAITRSPVQTKLILEHNLFPLHINLTSRIADIPESGDGTNSVLCGTFTTNNPLIVGGQPTSPGEWPWIVPIFLSTEHGLKYFCSGTLVDNTHIVSAAHCYKDVKDPKFLIAHVGKHNIWDWTVSDSQPRNIKNVSIHPDFDSQTLYSDVALLELEHPVAWKENLAPACLWSGPDSLDLIVGRQGTVVGWGMDALNSTGVSAEPKAVVLPIVSQETCLRSKKEYLFLTSNKTFCAGEKNGAGPCNGDSGGGLYLPIKGQWYLRGVVSLSLLDVTTQKCDLYQYLVFADVAKFQRWIKENILESENAKE